MAYYWYGYIGGPDVTNVENYYKLNAQSRICLCGNTICTIYANEEDMNVHKALSANMTSYINAALLTGQLQPSHPFGAKKHVYLRY